MTTAAAAAAIDEAPAATAARRPPAGTVAAVVVLFVVGVALPLAVASHAGALGIPRSDDWSYLVSLFRWVGHGRLAFNDWVSMTLVGQLVLTAPLVAVVGHSIAAAQVFAALLGFGGLLALRWLGRQLLAPARGATLVAVTIAIGPLWAPLASTYMTDVPAFAAQMLALGLAASAFRCRPMSMPRLGAALAVGFVGISIRQYGVIPEVAILVVAVWALAAAGDRRRLRTALVMGAVAAVATAALLAWWASLPDALSLAPEPPGNGVVGALAIQSAGFLRLAGLLVVPVVLLAGPTAIVRRAWRAGAGLTVAITGLGSVWLLVTYARTPTVPFVGNYVERHGVLADDVLFTGHRGAVMPGALFDLLVLVGSAAGLVLLLAAVPFLARGAARLRARRLGPVEPTAAMLGLSVAGFALSYAIAIATGLPIFDRYALPAIPLVALLLLHSGATPRAAALQTPALQTGLQPPAPSAPDARSHRGTLAVVAVAVGGLALVGLAFSTDSASFDATRWHVAEHAVARGYAPLAVNGGFEWVAYHRGRGPARLATAAERHSPDAGYLRFLCVDVVVNPTRATAARALARGEIHGLLHAAEPVVAVRNGKPCRR